MGSRYDHLNREEMLRLLEARDQRDATRFGLVWEANEIERDKALNNDFVALDLVREQCVGAAPWRNLIIEGDNYDALRYLRMTFAGQVKCILIDPPYNTAITISFTTTALLAKKILGDIPLGWNSCIGGLLWRVNF